jgi:hypothetical protein
VVHAIAAAGEIAMAKEYAEAFFGMSNIEGLDLSEEALEAAAQRCALMPCWWSNPPTIGVLQHVYKVSFLPE